MATHTGVLQASGKTDDKDWLQINDDVLDCDDTELATAARVYVGLDVSVTSKKVGKRTVVTKIAAVNDEAPPKPR